MRRKVSVLSLLLVIVLLGVGLTGCLGGGEEAPKPGRPSEDGVLRMVGTEPTTLDPAASQDVASWSYLLHIYSGLVGLNEELEVVPDLASSWDVSPDGLTYTFKLRPDAKFHDGKPVKASDVKYSINRACDPKLRSPVALTYLGDIVGAVDRFSGKASDVRGVVVKDDSTVEITIDEPKQYFLAKLTYSTAYVVDQANVESGGDWTKRPNGTGPFKLKEWKSDESIALERNDLYYGQKPLLKEVLYDLRGVSPMSLYEKGQIDVMEVGLADIERVTDKSSPLNQELHVTPMLGLTYIGFNTQAKPFDDVKVRQAFVQALNREKIANVLYKGTKVKAEGILPPGMPGYDEGVKGLAFDESLARKLIDESSYGGVEGLPPITFSLSAGGAGIGKSYADIYREALGINIEVEQVDSGYFEELDAGAYQIFFLGWVADYPDPQDFLDILFHTGSQTNETRYSNPKVDELLERARREANPEARMELYRQAERIIIEEAPVIPLYHDVTYTLVKPYVKGLQLTPMGILSLKTVTIEP